MNPSLHRLGQLLVLIALFAVSGGHWAALQSVAWTTMIVDYAHEGSVSGAVEKTFDGQHPCDLCKSIAKGKQNEAQQEIRTDVSKLNLFCERFPKLLNPPQESCQQQLTKIVARTRTNRPLVPPPRA